MYYIDLLVKEYTGNVNSSRYYPVRFWVLTFFLVLCVTTCAAFVGFGADFLGVNWSASINFWGAVISGVIIIILVIPIYWMVRKTKTPQTDIEARREKIEKFLKRHELEGMDIEQMQELIKCIEDRADELQLFKPIYSKIKGLFVVYIVPIGAYTVRAIAQGLDMYKLVLGSIWCIFFLAAIFAVGYVLVKLIQEIFDKPMQQYHVMAQDLRVYCALNGK